jgi:4-amino-4-deoxy-L-arabinose transferase-like glycosyltransferase
MSAKRAALIAFGIILAHVALLGWIAYRDSPVHDETAHLAAGVSHWRYGRFEIYNVNPPLVRMLAALPVLGAGCEEDWSSFAGSSTDRAEFAVGRDFCRANGERVFWLFTLARWACIPISVLGALVCRRWAAELYGPVAGLVARLLWCFSPYVLANACLITTDAAAAAFGVLAGYAFWNWQSQRTWELTILAGVCLGLAELAKFTWIILFLLWPALWLCRQFVDRRRDWLKSAMQLGCILTLGVATINIPYGLDGSFTRLGDFQFVSESFAGPLGADRTSGNRFAGSLFRRLPIPLPREYLSGIDSQRRDFEVSRTCYVAGEFKHRGWWWYYLFALAVKSPVGFWILMAIAAFQISKSVRSIDTIELLAPGLALLILVSSQTGINGFSRYALPVLPFAFIWCGKTAILANAPFAIPYRRLRKRNALAALVALSLLWYVMSVLIVFPHLGSYFNEVVGGPRRGAKWLLGSDIGWGQDLLNLKRWLDDHPQAHPLKLAYVGNIDPRLAGIDFELPPRVSSAKDLPPGWYAVGASLAQGGNGYSFTGDGRAIHIERGRYAYFAELEPTAMAGYSIYIYEIK